MVAGPVVFWIIIPIKKKKGEIRAKISNREKVEAQRRLASFRPSLALGAQRRLASFRPSLALGAQRRLSSFIKR